MRKSKFLLILFTVSLLVSLIFPMYANKVCAATENVVTLNFGDGIIHDGYVEYSKIGKLQLFKGDELVANISNNMTIDLNEADYKFAIEEIENKESVSSATTPIKLNINNWYYPMTTILGETRSTFKLESSKFSGKLDVILVRAITAINTKVENVYEDISSKGVIDLTNGKEYVIDFSKTDELTEGLKSFADLDKTLYYKRDNKGLLVTDNESEAVIKIVGNKSENKAILTVVNVGTKKSEVFKGLHTQYTGSALNYDGTDGGIINETRFDYYTRCTYEFTFQYVKEEINPKEFKFIEGVNQTYTIGESNNATFRVDAEYNLFENGGKVYIDEALVDSKNYTSKSGSTIITLTDAYLKTLSVGEHTLKVAFTNGGNATTKFKVAKKAEENNNNGNNNNDDNNSSNNNNGNSSNNNSNSNNKGNNNSNTNTSSKPEIEDKKDNISNPQTGDKVVIYFILSAVCVVGIVTLVIIKFRKNKKERES